MKRSLFHTYFPVLLVGVLLAGSVALAAPLDDIDAYCAAEVAANAAGKPLPYKNGFSSGCRDGYQYGYDAGRGTYPNTSVGGVTNIFCDIGSHNALRTTGTTQTAGYDNGCLLYYEKGFADGDKEVIDAPDSALCPANLKKTSGPNAGAFTNGCSYGFKNGKAGSTKPLYCINGLYSPAFEQGCTAGYQAGVAAATPPAAANPPSNALIVPFAGLTSYEVGLDTYINAVYRWSIGLAALLAVFQIVFGGVLYVLAAGSLYSQEEATGKMKNAAIGLLLLLSISLILTVINPKLTLITPSGSASIPWYIPIIAVGGTPTP